MNLNWRNVCSYNFLILQNDCPILYFRHILFLFSLWPSHLCVTSFFELVGRRCLLDGGLWAYSTESQTFHVWRVSCTFLARFVDFDRLCALNPQQNTNLNCSFPIIYTFLVTANKLLNWFWIDWLVFNANVSRISAISWRVHCFPTIICI